MTPEEFKAEILKELEEEAIGGHMGDESDEMIIERYDAPSTDTSENQSNSNNQVQNAFWEADLAETEARQTKNRVSVFYEDLAQGEILPRTTTLCFIMIIGYPNLVTKARSWPQKRYDHGYYVSFGDEITLRT